MWKRKNDPIDRRMNRIKLTKKAHDYKEKLFEIVLEWQKILLNDLSDKEKNDILRILKKMKDNSLGYKTEKTNFTERKIK